MAWSDAKQSATAAARHVATTAIAVALVCVGCVAAETDEGNTPSQREREAALRELNDRAEEAAAGLSVSAVYHRSSAEEFERRIDEAEADAAARSDQMLTLQGIVDDPAADADAKAQASEALRLLQDEQDQRADQIAEWRAEGARSDGRADEAEAAAAEARGRAGEIAGVLEEEEERCESQVSSSSTATTAASCDDDGVDESGPSLRNVGIGLCFSLGGIGPANRGEFAAMAPLAADTVGLFGIVSCGAGGGIVNIDDLVAQLDGIEGVVARSTDEHVVVVMPGASLTPEVRSILETSLGPLVIVDDLGEAANVIGLSEYIEAEPVVGLAHIRPEAVERIGDALGNVLASDLLNAPPSIVEVLPFEELDPISGLDLLNAPPSSLHQLPIDVLGALPLVETPELLVLVTDEQLRGVVSTNAELQLVPLVVPTGLSGIAQDAQPTSTSENVNDGLVQDETPTPAAGSSPSTDPTPSTTQPSTTADPPFATTSISIGGFTSLTRPPGLGPQPTTCAPLSRALGC